MVREDHQNLNKTAPLILAAQKGDRKALERLFARYLPRVRAIAALRMGRRMQELFDLEDVVQEALLKAFQGLGRFEHKSEGCFRNWLACCVEREVANCARKAGAKKRGCGQVRRFADFNSGDLTTSIFAGKSPTPSAVVQGAEMENKVEEAIIGLPKLHREAIILRYICKMSYREIVEYMKLTNEVSARKACSRALQKLKEKVGLL